MIEKVVKLLSVNLFYLFISCYKKSYRRDFLDLHGVLTSSTSLASLWRQESSFVPLLVLFHIRPAPLGSDVNQIGG